MAKKTGTAQAPDAAVETPAQAPRGPAQHVGHTPSWHNRPSPRATAAAAARAVDKGEIDREWPKTYYRKVTPSEKHPNGYEARQVASPEAAERLGDEWQDTPEDMTPPLAFGHDAV